MNIISKFKKEIFFLIQESFGLAKIDMKNISIFLNTEKEGNFGDLSCNAAMVLSKVLKKSPKDLAIAIVEKLSDKNNKFFGRFVEKAQIAGPGFINIFLQKNAWQKIAWQLYEQKSGYYQLDKDEKKLKYLIEFISANPTGPMHLGHGRNGIIGDTLARVLQLVGHDVEKEFYVNDAGNQIQKLGKSFKIRCQQELGQKVELPEDGYKGKYLIDLAKKTVKEFGKDILSKEEDFFVQYAKENMLEKIKQDCAIYGIKFDNWFSEKTLHESGAIEKVLKTMRDKNIVYEKEGALWFRSSQFGDEKDRVVKKSDGSLTYIAADIAYHKNKFERGFDILIDVLGQDHHGYVKRLKGTMEALGFNQNNLQVILYQLVSLKKGEEAIKMSKRAGAFITLKDVIETVGKDVARFFYLNRKAEAHLEIDLSVALKKTEENPVYYIQYAYVRTGSILEKAKEIEEFLKFLDSNDLQINDEIAGKLGDPEIVLLKKIASLQDILDSIVFSYGTHMMAYYTFEFAHFFHNYYANNRVIDADNILQSKLRLFIIVLVRQTLQICLDLLGLDKPEKM